MGLIQEFVIWPNVMAVGAGLKDAPGDPVVVEEAIAMFLARYRTERRM
jgi:TetR/AcrR family transcriptional regulator of autoinduction and epiphytic fitness